LNGLTNALAMHTKSYCKKGFPHVAKYIEQIFFYFKHS
jgi:hypothetical protein